MHRQEIDDDKGQRTQKDKVQRIRDGSGALPVDRLQHQRHHLRPVGRPGLRKHQRSCTHGLWSDPGLLTGRG